jgi:hypothetical protein
MNKDVQEKWTTALRSGKYSQAHGKLRTPEGLCCLGVLCEVAVENGAPVKYDADNYTYNDAAYVLPFAVRDWAGLAGTDPSIDIEVEGIARPCLSELNDTANFTFEQIADVIEEKL